MTTHQEKDAQRYCAQPPQRIPALPPGLSLPRTRAILANHSKWVNGTQLRYSFLDGADDGVEKAWLTEVHNGFEEWESLGVGLQFRPEENPAESEIRITFADDGSWSYVGTDCLGISSQEATMNFGWDPTSPYGKATVRHEIGHSIGFFHEHQNPFAGIEWYDDKVYASMAGPPNFWPRETTYENIIRKLSTDQVTGSRWDDTSIMEYGFGPGLIKRPEAYQNGIPSPLTLSETDKEYVCTWYPSLTPHMDELKPSQSAVLDLDSGGQANYEVVPENSQKYQFGTFGNADVKMVLFEEADGENLRYVTGEDDSGEDRNSRFEVKLFKGRRYVLRVRMYSTWGSGKASVMYW
ncbi:M12 family metallopeptidase [Streptomyces atratus]|uniref:M12 family metallopeptidase n=1 Tax=Streptomyces atratus TaxID=1893 RepID=UPI0021A47C89|nr:M12 family metallopeptidase [Streptomyces atratus]MCT2546976.1 M12 family metallopeptidase [Streptomyces atratus]